MRPRPERGAGQGRDGQGLESQGREPLRPGHSGDLPGVPPTAPERAAQELAVWAIVILCVLISLAVLSRWVWTSVVPDEVQWVQILMVVIVLAPLAVTGATRQHIEVELFTSKAPPALRRFLAVFGHLAGLAFFGFLTWAVGRLFLAAWESGEYYDGAIHIPEWLGKGLFLLCVAIGMARMFAMLATDLAALFRRST